MRMPESTPRRGTGSSVTLSPKNSNVPHDPKPRTERGKRRAARRAAAAAALAAHLDADAEGANVG